MRMNNEFILFSDKVVLIYGITCHATFSLMMGIIDIGCVACFGSVVEE